MDWIKSTGRIKEAFGKYKFVLLVLCVGILLMTFPDVKTESKELPVEEVTAAPKDIASELTEILGQIQGVGRVQVMVTESAARETVYQTDDDSSVNGDSMTNRLETVIVSQNGTEQGLVRTVTPPVYLGAVIVCQGGGDPRVQLAVTQAVSSVTGIGTDHITVLKMK